MPKPEVFNESAESFRNYKERLDAYIEVNDVADVKKTSLLLASIGPKTYQTLRSLCAPDLPSTKQYAELCGILLTHFSPVPLEIMERYKFHKRDQSTTESIADYIANIKHLSEHCNFGENLSSALRDRFVCGLKDQTIQKRLLQERTLTFDNATSLAIAMETATKDAAQLHGTLENIHLVKASSHKSNSHRHQGSSIHKKATEFPPCSSCGKSNHARSNCYFRDATCKNCHKQGHLQAVCRQKKSNPRPKRQQRRSNVHSMQEEEIEDQFGLQIYQLNNNQDLAKITTTILLDDTYVKMEIDTGSALSIMSANDYKGIFKKHPYLQPTEIQLRTYTGEKIKPLGFVTIQVRPSKDQESKELRLFIVNTGSNPILGREWLNNLKLDWQEIKKLDLSVSQFSPETEFPDLFSPGIGTIQNMSASLKLQDNSKPKFLKSRSVPYALKSKIEKELQNLEEQAILTKVPYSEWATPIVPVIKRSGDIRICGDYKVTINPVLEAEQYTLPRMEDMMANLQQGTKFSKIDLRQAYLQLPLDTASKQLTTINTHQGLYQYNRLVFGITSAPAIWQKTMDTLLQGLEAQCNQDDIIVTGKNDEDHLKNLRAVLHRLQESGLKANLEKCHFFKDEVIFCGIKISCQGLHKTKDKIEAIVDAPIPTNKTQLRSFLGLVNYYHKWLNNIASIAKPLYDQLQQNRELNWSNECQKAFDTIKDMISSDQVLIRYDPNLPLKLASDASPYGIGAVLSHVTHDGDERPIAYISRTLSPAEQKYSQIDKEALAIVWSVKKFFNYLCGRHFTLVTDHQPLKYIFSPTRGIPAMSAARQQRYALFLSGFDYQIEYRSSKCNANADGLSRLPLPDTSTSTDIADEVYYSEIMTSLPVNATIVAKESRHDPVISRVISHVKNHDWPDSQMPEIQPYYHKRQELVVEQDCLLWGFRIVVPENLHKSILSMLHEGHPGIVKMKNLARSYVWWPGIDKEIENISRACNGCSAAQPDPPKAPMHPWHWPDRVWQRIHIDYAGPFMGSMFLIVIDASSKWAEITPVSSSTTTTTIDILGYHFARFGIPEHLVSDNGPQFTSAEFRAFIRSNGIKHTYSAPYHPATNGLAERMVQTFKKAMKASKNDNGSMHTKLARFLLSYRNTPHSTTNETPAFLMFGRNTRTRMDTLRPDTRTKVTSKQQLQTQSHSQSSLRQFDIGNTVLARDYRGHQRWQHGTIIACIGSRNYEIEIAPGIVWKRHSDQIVHTNTGPDISRKPIATPELIVNVPTSETNRPTEPTMAPQSSSQNDQTFTTRSSGAQHAPPPKTASPTSPTPRDPQSERTHTPAHVTRSGRVIKKPTKYTY